MSGGLTGYEPTTKEDQLMRKVRAILIAVTAIMMVLGISAVAFAEDEPVEKFEYNDSTVQFIKTDGTAFGMWAPQEGSTITRRGDTVIIHIVPKNTTVYGFMHWGFIDDAELTKDVTLTEEGYIDLAVDKEKCGYAHAVAPIKPDGNPTKDQYYLAIPPLDNIPEYTVSLIDGKYELPDLKAGPSAMFNHFEANSKYLEVEGDKATISFITDGSTTSIQKYSRIAIGKSSELVKTEYQQDLPEGTYIIDGEQLPDDGTGKAKYLFKIEMAKADIEELLSNDKEEDIYIILWNKVGKTGENIPGWYKASDDIYLSLGDTGDKDIPLEITNNTGMFKVVTASYKEEKGSKSLVVALSSNGYENLFKGTYEQAKANGNKTENWIHGSKNVDDKWEFEIPLEEGEKEIAIVSISKSKYQDYLDDRCPIERAFYPRLLVLDEKAGTLVTGDYEQTFKVAVKNNVKMFKPGDEADLKIVGGPNSNNYGGFITLHMESDSMDCVRAKTYDYKNMELTEGDEIEIPVAEGNIFEEIPVLPALLGDTVTIEFRSKNNGKWYKRDFTLDLEKKEATFDPYAGDVVVQKIAALESVDAAKEYAKTNATPKLTDLLIEAIQVQERDVNTDKLCAAAKASWDTLTADEKKEVEEADYFGLDTGDASKDDPLNTAPVKEKELLVVSFGTSFNDSRVATIGAVEKALAKAFPDYAARRAFTAQIIINHIAARDGEQIDNVAQAMDKAVAAGVKEMIVQPTHLMSGAEYDELKKEIDKYADKLDIKYAKPLLDSDADKELVAKEVVAAAAKDAGYADTEAAIADKDTAFVFMGHGTAHEAKATYTYMQQTMTKLGFKNCFIGTVEGEPEETEVHEILKKVQNGGFKKVVLRPLMVVAGDHANNDMAGDEDDSWKSIFAAALGAENVKCQIKGLGEIEAVQALYVAHTSAVIEEAEEEKKRAAAVEEANKEVEIAEKIDTSKYSKANAEAITAAIQALKTVIGDAKSTSSQINAAREALSAAISKADGDKETSEQIKKVKAGKIYKFKAKAAKKKVTFTWKKNTLFSGYQLKYKVGSKTKVVKIKSAKTVKKVVKKLKKGKKVKAQIRGYKVISGKTYYGKWAKSKTVKVK